MEISINAKLQANIITLQVTSLKHVLSYILELEEDWLAAAKVLMGIQMETTSR
jgi:hypothetical protein